MEALRRIQKSGWNGWRGFNETPTLGVVQPTEPPACAGRATKISYCRVVFTAGGGVQVAKLPCFLRALQKAQHQRNETVMRTVSLVRLPTKHTEFRLLFVVLEQH